MRYTLGSRRCEVDHSFWCCVGCKRPRDPRSAVLPESEVMTLAEIPGTLLEVYRWIIGSLAGTITVLAGANAWQWREAMTIARTRLSERDVLNKALSDNNSAIRDMAGVADRHYEALSKLGDVTSQISVAIKLLTERLDAQYGRTNKDVDRAFAETSHCAELLRGLHGRVEHGMAEIRAELIRLHK